MRSAALAEQRAEMRLRLLQRARRASARLPGGWDRRLREAAKVAVDYRGARGSGLRGMRFSRLGRHSRLLLAPFGQAQLLVDSRDDEIGRIVFMTGGYERIYMRTALQVMAENGVRVGGRTFVDVGANIGTSTVDALVHFGFGRAACFEPDAANARLLRLNLVLNGLADRATVHQLALSDHDGDGWLRRSPHNSGDHRVGAGTTADVDGEAVGLARLDTLVASGDLDPGDIGLAWIDTQGHEAFVLAGAASLTTRRVPVLLEYSPAALNAVGAAARLEDVITGCYRTVVDVHRAAAGCRSSAVTPAHHFARLADRLHGVDHTDLLLL